MSAMRLSILFHKKGKPTAELCVKQQPVTLMPGFLPETCLFCTVFMQKIFSDTQDSCDYSP